MPDFLGPWFAWSLFAVLAYVTAVWVLSLRLEDSGIMDIFWGPGFVLAIAVPAAYAPGATFRTILVVTLVTAWAARLAWHIGRRNLGKPEDARYAKWRSEAGAAWWWRSWFKVFLLQGVILWLVSFPLQAAVSSSVPAGLTLLDLAGALVFLTGLGIEAVADAQLAAFKRDPGNRGRIMDQGLWGWSRHPNYFGEAVIWIGAGLMALAVPGGWTTLFGPLLMIWLLIRVSGVRMLDDLLVQTKPGYAEYIRRTSAFIPRPPRA